MQKNPQPQSRRHTASLWGQWKMSARFPEITTICIPIPMQRAAWWQQRMLWQTAISAQPSATAKLKLPRISPLLMGFNGFRTDWNWILDDRKPSRFSPRGLFYVPMLISAPSAPFPFSVHKATHKNKRLPKLHPNRNLFVLKGNHFYFLLSTILRASFL